MNPFEPSAESRAGGTERAADPARRSLARSLVAILVIGALVNVLSFAAIVFTSWVHRNVKDPTIGPRSSLEQATNDLGSLTGHLMLLSGVDVAICCSAFGVVLRLRKISRLLAYAD